MASQLYPGALSQILAAMKAAGATVAVEDDHSSGDYTIMGTSYHGDGIHYTLTTNNPSSGDVSWVDDYTSTTPVTAPPTWTTTRIIYDPYDPVSGGGDDETEELRAEVARLKIELERAKPKAAPVPFVRRPGERRFG